MNCLTLKQTVIALGVATMFLTPVYAQKSKGGNTSPLPPVRYQVGFIAVPGLSGIAGINDAGQTLCNVDIDSVSEPVDTLLSHTLAIVELNGTITYLDNVLNTETSWDLHFDGTLNNYGEILATGRRQLDDGTFVLKPLLLSPDGAGRYDVTEINIPASRVFAFSMNDAGDMAVYERDAATLEELFSILHAGGGSTDLSALPITAGDGQFANAMNNFGQFLAYVSGETARVNPDGTVTWCQHLADADFPTDGGWFPEVATDLNDHGVIVGAQPDLEGKGRTARRRARPVIYNTSGVGQWLDAPPAYEVRTNNQIKSGGTVAAGYTVDWSVYYPGETTTSTDLTKDLWIRFPGYSGKYVVDLMDTPNKQAWASLKFHDWNYSTGMEFELLTPRLADGSVDHYGYPTIMGLVTDSALANENAFGIGLFVLGPIVLP